MRILFIISSLGTGGAERVMSVLANRWCQAHEIGILTLKDETDFYPLNEGIVRYKLQSGRSKWYRPLPYIRLFSSIRRIVNSYQPDFIVSFVLKTNLFVLGTLNTSKWKVIVCEHSVIQRNDIDGRQAFLRKILYSSAYKVSVLSLSIYNEFLQCYPRFPKNKLYVIPNPIDQPEAKGPSISIAGYLGIEEGRYRFIVSMGRFVPLKGYDKLLQAFSILNLRKPETRLVVFGDGPELQRLQQSIRDLGLANKVFLPGYISKHITELSGIDVFSMTSQFEGMPMALLEAMQAGIPVVAFSASGVNDIVTDGKNGLLVEQGNVTALAESIVSIMDNKKLARSLVINASESILRYSSQNVDQIWFNDILI